MYSYVLPALRLFPPLEYKLYEDKGGVAEWFPVAFSVPKTMSRVCYVVGIHNKYLLEAWMNDEWRMFSREYSREPGKSWMAIFDLALEVT